MVSIVKIMHCPYSLFSILGSVLLVGISLGPCSGTEGDHELSITSLITTAANISPANSSYRIRLWNTAASCTGLFTEIIGPTEFCTRSFGGSTNNNSSSSYQISCDSQNNNGTIQFCATNDCNSCNPSSFNTGTCLTNRGDTPSTSFAVLCQPFPPAPPPLECDRCQATFYQSQDCSVGSNEQTILDVGNGVCQVGGTSAGSSFIINTLSSSPTNGNNDLPTANISFCTDTFCNNCPNSAIFTPNQCRRNPEVTGSNSISVICANTCPSPSATPSVLPTIVPSVSATSSVNPLPSASSTSIPTLTSSPSPTTTGTSNPTIIILPSTSPIGIPSIVPSPNIYPPQPYNPYPNNNNYPSYPPSTTIFRTTVRTNPLFITDIFYNYFGWGVRRN